MTPKERLERIKTVIKNGGVYRDYTDSIKPFMEDIKAVEEALGVSYPTSEEVCKALIDYFKKSKYHGYIDTAYYSEEGKYFYTEDENRSLVELMFDNYYIHEIPPHLITLIGRFYEKLGVKDV